MVAQSNIIRERLDKIRQHYGYLKDYERYTIASLRSDYGEQMKILHLLQIAIEACIDISAHIVTADQLGVPNDHADLFRILGEHKIINSGVISRLQEMVRFRNRLVHFYLSIDLEHIVSILNNNLKDFNLFIADIESYLQKG